MADAGSYVTVKRCRQHLPEITSANPGQGADVDTQFDNYFSGLLPEGLRLHQTQGVVWARYFVIRRPRAKVWPG